MNEIIATVCCLIKLEFSQRQIQLLFYRFSIEWEVFGGFDKGKQEGAKKNVLVTVFYIVVLFFQWFLPCFCKQEDLLCMRPVGELIF